MKVYSQLVKADLENLANDPSSPSTGRIWYNTTTGTMGLYNGSNASHIGVPVGAIIPWIGGYFTNGSNGSYTRVLGTDNTVAAVNTLLNGSGWYVCNGAALNDSTSPIFNGASRYLPNISDSRFLQGYTAAGSTGGSNTVVDHTHTFSLTAAGQSYSGNSGSVGTESANHQHNFRSYNIQFGGTGTFDNGVRSYDASPYSQTLYTSTQSANHNHTVSISHTHSSSSVSGSVGSGSAPSSTDNRPVYLTCFYIMKVK